MRPSANLSDVTSVAAAIDAEITALSVRTTATMRAIRRAYTRTLQHAGADVVLHLARKLLEIDDYRWFAYELIQCHPAAFACLGAAELEDLGRGINSWWTVDAFARTLSGPAWRDGQIPDTVILAWTHSPDRW